MYRTREGARSSWYADFPKAHDQSLEYRHLITQDGTPLMGRDQYNPLLASTLVPQTDSAINFHWC